MSRSTARPPRGFCRAVITAAYMRPYACAAATSNGIASKVLSAHCKRSRRLACSGGCIVERGPAVSSAKVKAEIEASAGRSFSPMNARSMTTEVSSTPRWCLGTWCRVLIDRCVDIGSELFEVDAGQVRSRLLQLGRRNESSSPCRGETANGHPITGHDKGVPALKRPHDFSVIVAQFALGNRSLHTFIVAQTLRHPRISGALARCCPAWPLRRPGFVAAPLLYRASTATWASD